jgi:hypothetical protein
VLHYYENKDTPNFDVQSSLKYPLIVSGAIYLSLTYLPGLCGFDVQKTSNGSTSAVSSAPQISAATVSKLARQDVYSDLPNF